MGFFITENGFLVTNEHVGRDAVQVRLVTSAGLISAKVVKVDATNDLALLKVEGKLLVRFHQDGENIVVPMSKAERTRRMRQQPAVFHITDHYAAHPYLLVRLDTVDVDDLAAVLEAAWRRVAP